MRRSKSRTAPTARRAARVIAITDAEVDALILEGLEAHKAGDLRQARESYARALGARPDHVDALNLSGALASAQGRHAEAARLIAKSVQLLPSHLDARLNLAEALEKAGRPGEAIAACHNALAVAPDLAEAHARLARLHAEAGEYSLALAFARVALALSPGLAEAHCARGLAYRFQRQYPEADAAYRQAIAVAPDDVAALTGLAALLNETDFVTEAAELLRRAVALKPGDPELLAWLAMVVERNGETRSAVGLYEEAMAIDPRSPDYVSRRASCLRDLGEFDAAEAGFLHALSLSADHPPSVMALVRMKRLKVGEEQRKRLARQMADPSRPVRHRVQAGFALGESFERSKEFDAAFGRFAAANSLYARFRADQGEVFDRQELRSLVNLIDERLASEYANDTSRWANPTDRPVFIVGMPRSGTTLVEQICASHSQVHGAGELRAIQMAARRIAARNQHRPHIRDWDADFARAEADNHARELERRAAGAKRVVDKNPFNLMRLGVIGAMFPGARVIWCRRDPRDVALSNHTLYFGQGNAFSTDQSDCAYAVRQIDRLGEVWLRESKLPILQVSYEDLVADLEAHTRRIIDFLGLDWEPACLEFHQTDRHVDTPSSWQVRQPIYSTSVGRWRRFERHLGPMLATLAASD